MRRDRKKIEIFPKLPVVEVLKESVNHLGLLPNSTYLIGVQHLMESTGSLIEAIIDTGLLPENIFLLGKIYSTHQETLDKLRQIGINSPESTLPKEFGTYRETLSSDVKKLWEMLIIKIKPNDKIIILDDGGYCLKNTPEEVLINNEVVGIEQTTSGIRLQNEFDRLPVIDVASSYLKTNIEPWIVIDAIIRKTGTIIESFKSKVIGIVGYGHIGKILAQYLIKNGFTVIVFDKEIDLVDIPNRRPSINDLFLEASLIIGCTGEDCSSKEWIKIANEDKLLMGFSSGDIEFNSLIKLLNHDPLSKKYFPLDDLSISTNKGFKITVKRGGYVANFDRTKESSPANIIQLTRGLLFSAFLSSFKYSHKTVHGRIPLDEKLQDICYQIWNNFNNDFIEKYGLEFHT